MLLDKKAYPIESSCQPHHLLFQKSHDSAQLKLLAALTLKDGQTLSKMFTSVDLDLNDPSILALQQSFAEAQEKKDANKSAIASLLPCMC